MDRARLSPFGNSPPDNFEALPMQEPQTVGALLVEARSHLVRLEPAQALQAHKNGALLIDTRCTDDRRRLGKIPGAVHVPLSVLLWRLDPTSEHRNPELADRSRQVILFCNDGCSSGLAAASLQRLGFVRATDVIGGANAWIAAGLPVERDESAASESVAH
jgi:rhodanese-related sulfurtransferase